MSSATATAAQILLVAQAFLLGLVVVQLQSRFVDRIRDRLDDLRVDALALEIDDWDERAARSGAYRGGPSGSARCRRSRCRSPPGSTTSRP